MNEEIITKGKTNGIICLLLCFLIIIISETICVKLFELSQTSETIATIFTIYVPINLLIIVFSIVFSIKMARSNIKVTDTRIYGKTIGKNFDIPYNEIEEFSLKRFKGVSIKTKFKTIKIFLLINNENIYERINEKITK